ncbi:alpha/beta fold hydrolase [Streptosporangium sp. NPDC049644]|uniref:alpha/beta hydrolase n=1 Tax=Streptosporangium sp. NPDC049644 TaxID=3155507 RepID=UPI003437618F
MAHLLFHPPRKKHHREPDHIGLPSSVLVTTTDDGIDLHLWLIPGDGAGVVILGHGIGLTKSASLPHAALLHELGYHVVMFDHRNHGLSGGDPSQDRLAERYSNDIAACLGVAADTWPDSGAPIVWGFSFSTFSTLYSLRTETTAIGGIICDSGPGLDLDAMLRHFLTEGGLPGPPWLTRLLSGPSVAAEFAGAAVGMLGASWPPDPHTSASGITPMLYLTGTQDRIVASEDTIAVAALYPHATVAELPAGHLRGLKAAGPRYVESVVSYLGSLRAAR